MESMLMRTQPAIAYRIKRLPHKEGSLDGQLTGGPYCVI